MICIITGDIVGSRKLKNAWLTVLKNALKQVAKRENSWEIFRGDSFQVEVKPEDALTAAAYIKACIRTTKPADVRMGIGIGKKRGTSRKLTEATGEAFILSGEAFDNLKQSKINLAIKTAFEEFNYEMNICIALALIAMDNWGTAAAEVVKLAMEQKDKTQVELAAISGRTQSSVSEALKRAYFNEVGDLTDLYRKKLALLKI